MPENETADIASTTETNTETNAEATDNTATGETAEATENQATNAMDSDSSTTENDQTPAAMTTEATESAPETPTEPAEPEEEEEITYHAVQKEDSVTAIWEMQGRKHLRTIDPRSREGAEILRLFTAEEGEEEAVAA